jgi:glycosyltransferase involved in cell wall biosynthesis
MPPDTAVAGPMAQRHSGCSGREPQDPGHGIAVVIPAFNEVRTIRKVVEAALQEVDRIIVVDDGSTDGTADVLQEMPAVVLRNPVNLGKAESLRRGMALALQDGAAAVITVDADGQHDPADIPRLIAAHARQPNSIIIGARLHEKANIPRRRYIANRVANFWIGWAAGYRLTDSQSGFRLYPAALLHAIDVAHNRARGFVFESEVLITAARAGVKSFAVPIRAVYRAHARPSYFRPFLDIVLITRMVAWKLVSRGMHIPGLIRSLRRERRGDHADA